MPLPQYQISTQAVEEVQASSVEHGEQHNSEHVCTDDSKMEQFVGFASNVGATSLLVISRLRLLSSLQTVCYSGSSKQYSQRRWRE